METASASDLEGHGFALLDATIDTHFYRRDSELPGILSLYLKQIRRRSRHQTINGAVFTALSQWEKPKPGNTRNNGLFSRFS